MRRLALAFGAVLMTACQTMPYQPYAREVKKKPAEGGVIALKTEHRTEDRQKADQLMAINCGNMGVKVVEEGEVVVGEKTNTAASTSANQRDEAVKIGGLSFLTGKKKSSMDTATSSETIQLKEWQISYSCVAKTTKKR